MWMRTILSVLYGVLMLPLDLLAFVVVPVAVLFTRAGDTQMPKIVRWFQTIDNPIDGANFWQTRWTGDSFGARWRRRTRWLLRNRLHYFSARVLGVWTIALGAYSRIEEDLIDEELDRFVGHDTGFRVVRHTIRGHRYPWPLYYLIVPYGRNARRCLEIKLGWWQTTRRDWSTGVRHPVLRHVFSISPFSRP